MSKSLPPKQVKPKTSIKMKITLFATVAMTAVIGIAFADEMFNNWNNDDNNRFGGFSAGLGQISGAGLGQMSSGFGSSYGIGSGYGAGYGASYGYSSGYGASSGYGGSYGYGVPKAAYVPVSPLPKAGGSTGIGSFLPIFFLLFLLPLLFNQSSTQDQIILLNSTLEG